MGARSEGAFDNVADRGEGGRVGCVLKGVEDSSAGSGRKVELARRVGSKVMGNYPVDFVAVRLGGGWRRLVWDLDFDRSISWRMGSLHDWRLSPAHSFASSVE